MTDLNDIAVFVKVAQFESFSRAAHSLGMPVSTVSRKVSALEDQLGVTLIQRTTRKLTLTLQGRAYYSQCSEPLSHLFDAEQVLTQTQKQPEGLLKISVPVLMGQEPFYEFLSAFLKRHPRIEVDLFITNLFVDLIAENVDVGIRFGELRDSTIVTQRIGKSVRYVVAAPDYLDGRPPRGKTGGFEGPSVHPAQRPQQRGGMASGQRTQIRSSSMCQARYRAGIFSRSPPSPIAAMGSAFCRRPIATNR